MVRVRSRNNLAEPFEILFALFFHEVVFVGQGPPNIPKGCEAADDIAKIMIILVGSHAIEPPMTLVVRMEEDKIGFDAEVPQVPDALFQVLKKFWIKSREIPIMRRRSFEWIQQRLVCIPIVALRKNAKADFVE